MRFEHIKENVSALWESVSEGWRHLWQSAAGALTRFKPGEKTNLPDPAVVDDTSYLPTRGWSMLGGDVFEDDQRVVVRLEVPGMEKEDLDISVQDDALIVSGEKRFQKEASEGRWRIVQCAYGSFRRVVPLPAAVEADAAHASYRNGVLRVELPKREPSRPQGISIRID